MRVDRMFYFPVAVVYANLRVDASHGNLYI